MKRRRDDDDARRQRDDNVRDIVATLSDLARDFQRQLGRLEQAVDAVEVAIIERDDEGAPDA